MIPSSPMPLNPWEVRALQYGFPANSEGENDSAAAAWRQLAEPIIYPGIYSGSGFDVMAILLQVFDRPNPQVHLGAVDCSTALVLCDLAVPDAPIVYVSPSFTELTGYTIDEIMGKNCRFLQRPPQGTTSVSKSTKSADRSAIRQMRQAIQVGEEVQVEITNYKKDGQRFTNLISIIPLDMDSDGHHYAAGFIVEI